MNRSLHTTASQRTTISEKIRRYPDLDTGEVAEKVGATRRQVTKIRWADKVRAAKHASGEIKKRHKGEPIDPRQLWFDGMKPVESTLTLTQTIP